MTARPPSVRVYGAGRLGLAVAGLAASRGADVAGVWNPHPLPPERAVLATGLPLEVDPDPAPGAADLWLLAVPDDAIADLAGRLAAGLETPGAPRPAAAAHAAGARPADLLAPLAEAGVPCGSWHPAMTFRGAAGDAAALGRAWAAIEGDAAAVALLERWTDALGLQRVRLDAGRKARYHAALVFASNGRVALDAAATELLAEAGVDPDDARRIVVPLVARTDENLASGGSADVLTGPVARGDARTVRAHLAALADRPDLGALYRALGRVALDLVPEERRGEGHREVAGLVAPE